MVRSWDDWRSRPVGSGGRERPLHRRDRRTPRVARSVPMAVAVAALAGLLTVTATSSASSRPAYQNLQVADADLTQTSTFTSAKTPTGAAAHTDKSLLGLTSSKLVNVMIKYDVDAVASYTGRIHGLKATSPRTTGKSFDQN